MATPLTLLKAAEFTDDRLTESINVPPYATGRPAQLGVFTDTPIHTTFVRLGIEEDEITVIPARERGGPSNLNMRSDRKGVTFTIPHFPLDDAITPSDIQNIVQFGSQFAMESVGSVYNQKLELMREKHDATHSHLDWGALNGIVLDGEGKELLNLYELFELEETRLNFALDIADTDVAAKNRAAKGIIRRELRGAPSTGVRALAGKEFFDRYCAHRSVKEELRAYAGSTPNPGRDDIADTFTFAGITFERIDENYKVRQANGTIVEKKAVPDDEAILLPLGTRYFKRYIAPPDTLAGANQPPEIGTKVFVSTEDLPHDKGREIHSESNVLPICVRPQLMVRLTLAG